MKHTLIFALSIWSCFCFAQPQQWQKEPIQIYCYGLDLFVIYAEVKQGMLFNESRSTQIIDAANFDQQEFLSDVQSILENQAISEGAKFILIRLVEADLDIALKLNELLRNEGYPVVSECRSKNKQRHEDMLEWIEKSMREETKKSVG